MNWKTAKGMMSDTNFLNSLKNMDVDGIAPGQVRMYTYMLLIYTCTCIRTDLELKAVQWLQNRLGMQ